MFASENFPTPSSRQKDYGQSLRVLLMKRDRDLLLPPARTHFSCFP